MNKLEELETISPEEELKNKLGENSEDFKDLQRLVKESNGKISWEDLKKFTKIENGKVEGIYWYGDLDLRGTNITSLGKIKKVNGRLNLYGVNFLTDLGELEEVGKDLDLRLTSIKSLGKLKKVGGELNLEGISFLTDLGELEEVGGYLDSSGTSITLQLQVLEKINSGKLKVKLEVYYDNFLNYFIKNSYFQKLLNYYPKLGEDQDFDGEFVNEFEKTFGKPGKRDEEINEVLYELLQILLKRYKETLLIKKEEIKQSKSGLTQDLVNYIQEDKEKKDMFLRIIFGDKMLNQAYEEVNKT